MPRGLLLLLLGALLLAAAPASARLVRPGEPSAPAAERGGQPTRPGQPPPACALALGWFSPFGFGLPCLGLQQIEAMTRLASGWRLALAAERPAWRAPRLVVPHPVVPRPVERHRH